ncbi:serine/threonine-protein kinase ULK1a isoform 2-T3 [Pholidichthys leucotaenia]
MESVGKFEFSRKDVLGHGSFAIVFKGRHKERHNLKVAVKCIKKKNFAKTQALLVKEIKILKELKHENIVGLLDYQEIGGCVYLVMEYCNGGDLADYLHTKGSLSEDTIRVIVQHIAQAMKMLHSKGILHRDLKPHNILISQRKHKSGSVRTIFKIADFGFARHLQENTMAATMCGSPMYMAPEVIMSRNYDAKADLWSIGAIVYQCLTGKAPFYASTPTELRLFYEAHSNLLPNIPKDTSSDIKDLLLGLLKRNHKERMSFEEFFHHPFLRASPPTKKSSSPPEGSSPRSGSGNSSSSSSTSQQTTPQHSKGEMHQLEPKEPSPPVQDTPTLPQKLIVSKDCELSKAAIEDLLSAQEEIVCQDSGNTKSYREDCIMLANQISSDHTEAQRKVESPTESCMINSRCSLVANRHPGTPVLHPLPKPALAIKTGRKSTQPMPIPVPTQIKNYQRIEKKLHGPMRVSLYAVDSSSDGSTQSGGWKTSGRSVSLSSGGGGMSPKSSDQTPPLGSRPELLFGSPDVQPGCSPKELMKSSRINTVPNLQSLEPSSNLRRKSLSEKGPFKRSVSTGKLSEMLLKVTSGCELFKEESDKRFSFGKSLDPTVPSTGCSGVFQFSDSPPPTVFTTSSASSGSSPPDTMLYRRGSDAGPSHLSNWLLNSPRRGFRQHSDTETMGSFMHRQVFCPPELPEDTLMEQAHSNALNELRFILAFVHCVMELACSKEPCLDPINDPDVSFLDQWFVTDQISTLSREWSYAEQLVLYIKAEEFLSSALCSAKENIEQGHLYPSVTVRQVIRKLNDLYKNCVNHCRSLSERLHIFLLSKHKLIDNFAQLTAEQLIYSHTVNMVQTAALDEMFHCGSSSVKQYHKALLLMEGLSRTLIKQEDIDKMDKCKQSIEQHLLVLEQSVSMGSQVATVQTAFF